MTENTYTCFFISPIGDKDSPEREHSDMVMEVLLRPALAECMSGVQCSSVIVRSDELNTPHITEEMIRHLKGDDLCIADLTRLNPNVFFEYGYRFSLGKPIIALARQGEQLPFDVYDVRVIRYALESNSINPASIKEAKSRLCHQIQQYLSASLGNQNIISPIDTIPSMPETNMPEFLMWRQKMNERIRHIEEILEDTRPH